MASTREIKRRMKSVKNIMQVTMALEAVSASKVRRATAQVRATRAYAALAMEMLMNIASANPAGPVLHPLLTHGSNTTAVTVLLITSDRGQAGAYNANMLRVARHFADEVEEKAKRQVRWVAVGRKGRDALIRMEENVIAEFTDLPAWLAIRDIRPIARVLIDDFLDGHCGEVYIGHTDFINTLTQRPHIQPLFPLAAGDMLHIGGDYMKTLRPPTTKVFADTDDGEPDSAAILNEMVPKFTELEPGAAAILDEVIPKFAIYEPGAAAILDEIVPKFTELVIFQSILESVASEHSARMVAMRNASDNAKGLSDDLQLSYNKARQTTITNEILGIVGGAEARP